MNTTKNFAGMIAVLLLMILSFSSVSAQSFSACSDDVFVCKFDEKTGILQVEVTSNHEADPQKSDSIRLYWISYFASDITLEAGVLNKELPGITTFFEWGKDSIKIGHVMLRDRVTSYTRKEVTPGTYTYIYTLQLTSQQIEFIKKLDAMPGYRDTYYNMIIIKEV